MVLIGTIILPPAVTLIPMYAVFTAIGWTGTWLPLIVPLTLLKHHLNRYPVPEWVHPQVYLHPYPKELMLRNHV